MICHFFGKCVIEKGSVSNKITLMISEKNIATISYPHFAFARLLCHAIPTGPRVFSGGGGGSCLPVPE